MLRSVSQTVVLFALLCCTVSAWAGTPQTITFPEIGVHMTTDAPFAMNATASSGLPVGYSIVSTGTVATLSGNTITLTGTPGSVTVKASQAGDGTHDAAVDVFRSFAVGDFNRRFVKVVGGGSHSAGIQADGTLWTWGGNDYGQVGDGMFNSNGVSNTRISPFQVGNPGDWIDVACGSNHTVAVRRDGTLWSWGHNHFGQLGDGTTTDRSSPVRVGNGNNWTAVASGGDRTVALRSEGTLWAWGSAFGYSMAVHSPAQVGSVTNWMSVSCGRFHSVAIRSDGTLWAWGGNSNGQLGDGTTSGSSVPVQIGNNGDWRSAACGAGHTVAVRSEGTLWAWGLNGSGQLGDGTTTQRNNPVQVGSDANWTSVACGTGHTVGTRSDGTLWTWGMNENGQLGDGKRTNQISPVQVGNDANWSSVACGGTHTFGLRTDGTLWAWGDVNSNRLGGELGSTHPWPVQVINGSTWRSVSSSAYHTVGIRSDGTLWAWGDNSYGQLGDGTTTERRTPIQVGGDTNWASVACGELHTMAIRTDGSLWAWGSSNRSQLGLGDGTGERRLLPIQVGNATDWVSVSCGHYHTAGLRADGTIWCWGANEFGQVGRGIWYHTLIAPVRVGSDSNWVAVACGSEHTAGLRSDGTLWTWGWNLDGQLGDGTGTSRNSPVQVGSASDWTSVSCGGENTAGIRSNGTLWQWGRIWKGGYPWQSGVASVLHPVQAGGFERWSAVSCGRLFMAGVRADGTLWAWGRDIYGQLGDGTLTDRSSPVQISSGVNWDSVECGLSHISALRSDGTLWAWGSNEHGQLGVHDPRIPARSWPARSPQNTIFNLPQDFFLGHSMTLAATSASGLAITYTVVGPATLNDNILTPTASGIVTLTAYQYGDSSWSPAESVSYVLPAKPPGPAIAISGNGLRIANGDMVPTVTDHTDFGSVSLLSTQVSRSFTITNRGVLPLTLTGTPKLTLSGPAAGDFEVVVEPLPQVAVLEATTFTIRFNPKLPGLRMALVGIANDDPDETPFTFAISGYGELDKPLTQTITFNAWDTLYLHQSPAMLEAYASSGLPVTLIVASGPATLSGNALTLTGPGTVKVQAIQPGGGDYSAAASVTRTIAVRANPTALTLINLLQEYNGHPKPIAVMGDSAPVDVKYLINGAWSVLPPSQAGRYLVRAKMVSTTKTGTLVITKAPLFVKADDKRKFAGQVNPKLTRTYDGFVNGETEAVLTEKPVLSTTAMTGSPGGLYAITSSGGSAANYTFIHQRGTMVVESFAGSYEALLVDATPLPVGRLNLTVTATSKSFTGKLHTSTETAALPLSGTLTTDTLNEQATGTVTVTKNGIPYVTTFTLPLLGDVSANATRDGQPLGSATNGKKLSTATVTHGGAYTMVLEPPTPALGAPAGAGWAKATISSKGVISLNGKLNDGTAFTSTLSPDGEAEPGYRWFAQPYLPARTGSFIAGAFKLKPHPNVAQRMQVEAASLTWKKSGLPGDASYRNGFGPLTTVMLLDPWQKPTTAAPLAMRLGLGGNTFTVVHSATGSASQGSLPGSVTLTGNAVSVTGTNPTKWKTTLDVTYGTFTGSFELKDGATKRTVPFSGVLRQPSDAMDSLIGDGHYLLPALPGALSNEKVSGEVLFQR